MNIKKMFNLFYFEKNYNMYQYPSQCLQTNNRTCKYSSNNKYNNNNISARQKVSKPLVLTGAPSFHQ